MKKQNISKETELIIEKNLENDTNNILEKVIVEEKQSEKDTSKFITIIGIIGPLLAIFQAIKIFVSQNAAGLSITYWGAYLVIASAWFGYGLYYKNKVIMVSYSLWIIVEIAILNGIFLFG